MDRKSITGFILLALLAVGYLFYSNQEASKFEAIRAKAVSDSLAIVKAQKAALPGPEAYTPTAVDTNLVAAGTPNAFVPQKAQKVSFGNDLITLDLTTKGGFPIAATLNNFKTYDQKPLQVWANDQENRLAFKVPIQGKDIWTDELNFTPEVTTATDGASALSMTADLGNNEKIVITYTLAKGAYMMDVNFRTIGLSNGLSKVTEIPVEWKMSALHTEKDLKNERLAAQMHFVDAKNGHDYFTISRKENYVVEGGVKWIGMKTPFFNSLILATQKDFTKASYEAKEPATDSSIVAYSKTSLAIPVVASNDFTFPFKWYIGPNDYNILKSYDNQMEEIIPLGTGIFFFVKYISKWFLIPIFNFLTQYITSFGLIIIVLTLIIRVLLSFFTYKSQLSSAKMRVLKPEIDELKKKYGDDQQQMGMEQMKLYRTAGVNPLGGCLPMLLQMPFLLSMYYFFPTAIQLRQAKFLWADDLSTFDNIFNLPFNIPFYGAHVSLFALLMAISSLFLALYSKNMTPGQDMNNPNMQMMKYMPYIMPVMFLGWFNNFAAGLTFYYFFSNILSMVQQFVIQKFLINEEKILAKIKLNKDKPATTSKWQERLEQVQKMQQDKSKK